MQVFAGGAQPYPTLATDNDVQTRVLAGERGLLPRPAACPPAVWTLLEACRIPHEQHLVNIMRADMWKPPLVDMNPQGRLPALKASGRARRTVCLPACLRCALSRHRVARVLFVPSDLLRLANVRSAAVPPKFCRD